MAACTEEIVHALWEIPEDQANNCVAIVRNHRTSFVSHPDVNSCVFLWWFSFIYLYSSGHDLSMQKGLFRSTLRGLEVHRGADICGAIMRQAFWVLEEGEIGAEFGSICVGFCGGDCLWWQNPIRFLGRLHRLHIHGPCNQGRAHQRIPSW